ncbi:MAG: glycosyltransferase family 4 protein [Verrucomicrobia bacterium]|nr:glycosyltransferase family 4 protein [Verrucomicrobiota bacterium]
MRVAWLAPYPVETLAPALRIARHKTTAACSWIVALSEAIARQPDIELHLLTTSQLVATSQTIRKENITFHVVRDAVPFAHRGWPPWFPWNALTGFGGTRRRLVAAVRQVSPDLVHAHGTEMAYALAGTDSRLPCLISIQGILTEYQKVTPSFSGRLIAACERAAVRRNRFFTCRTEFDTRFVRSVNPAAKIFSIHEAMNPVYFQNEWRPADATAILFVGSLDNRKGLGTLLSAMAILKQRFPECRLQIVGTGDLDGWQQRCRELEVAAMVDFLGFRAAREIARLHLESQLLVLPSAMDNSPNALTEAMVSGLPVVATAVGGIPSLVENGVTGVLVSAGDPEQLASAITTLLQDPAKRAALGRAGRMVARQRHRPETVAEQTVQAYWEILAAVAKAV